jgi:acyl-coenzyme A synthetase/AMP-(fatty) acid ligase
MPCGRLLPDISVALVDERGMTSPSGEIGELIVRSRHLALGYWQDGHLQREILENAASSFMKSGDLLRLRDDGLAELVGRTSRLVKIRGQRVDPGEIESVVRGSEEVAEAAVLCVPKMAMRSASMFSWFHATRRRRRGSTISGQ